MTAPSPRTAEPCSPVGESGEDAQPQVLPIRFPSRWVPPGSRMRQQGGMPGSARSPATATRVRSQRGRWPRVTQTPLEQRVG